MARVIEPDTGLAGLRRVRRKRLGLGAAHVGLEPAQPENARRLSVERADGNAADALAGSNLHPRQRFFSHNSYPLTSTAILSILPPCFAYRSSRGAPCQQDRSALPFV